MMNNKTVEYKVGEVYLCKDSNFYEREIIDIRVENKLIQTLECGWVDAADFNDKVQCKLGHYETKTYFFGLRSKSVFIKAK